MSRIFRLVTPAWICFDVESIKLHFISFSQTNLEQNWRALSDPSKRTISGILYLKCSFLLLKWNSSGMISETFVKMVPSLFFELGKKTEHNDNFINNIFLLFYE